MRDFQQRPLLPNINRVESIKILGVTISSTLSVRGHVRQQRHGVLKQNIILGAISCYSIITERDLSQDCFLKTFTDSSTYLHSYTYSCYIRGIREYPLFYAIGIGNMLFIMADLCNKAGHSLYFCRVISSYGRLWNRADHYIFMLWFVLLFFFLLFFLA